MPFPIILDDSITAVTNGTPIGIRGERLAIGNAKNRQRYNLPIEVFCQASGAAASTATVLVEVSRGDRKAITGITAANPGVVTATAHGFSSTDIVSLSGIVGMTQLNGTTVTVTVIDANSFSIGVDTTTYTAYSSGGVAMGPWVTWASLSFVIPASGAAVALNRVGALRSPYDYIRSRIPAISGATIASYVKRMRTQSP